MQSLLLQLKLVNENEQFTVLEIQHFQVIFISNKRVSIQKTLFILYCPFGFISFLSISLMFSIFIFCYKYNVPGLEWPLSLVFNWNWERRKSHQNKHLELSGSAHALANYNKTKNPIRKCIFFLSLLLRRALLQRVFI